MEVTGATSVAAGWFCGERTCHRVGWRSTDSITPIEKDSGGRKKRQWALSVVKGSKRMIIMTAIIFRPGPGAQEGGIDVDHNR